jgi:hypothetical protein
MSCSSRTGRAGRASSREVEREGSAIGFAGSKFNAAQVGTNHFARDIQAQPHTAKTTLLGILGIHTANHRLEDAWQFGQWDWRAAVTNHDQHFGRFTLEFQFNGGPGITVLNGVAHEIGASLTEPVDIPGARQSSPAFIGWGSTGIPVPKRVRV